MRIAGTLSAWARGASLALPLAVQTANCFGQGTIMHTVPPQPLYYSDRAPTQTVDVNNDGIPDFVLSTPNGLEINLQPVNNNAIISVPEPPPDIGAFIYALSPGTSISSSLNPVFAWWGTNDNYPPTIVACAAMAGCLGYFQNQTDAYAGIRLGLGADFYYGWIHIQNLGLNAGQISDWAFATRPDIPIFAGAVPEPSTWSLFSVGLLSIAFFTRKSRSIPSAIQDSHRRNELSKC